MGVPSPSYSDFISNPSSAQIKVRGANSAPTECSTGNYRLRAQETGSRELVRGVIYGTVVA